MGKKVDKFLLLMWKNWKLQYRRPLQTTVEVTAPILFSVLLVILRSLVDPVENPPHEYSPFHPIPPNFHSNSHILQAGRFTNSSNLLQNFTLVYSPSENAVLENCMSILKTVFKSVKSYKNSKQLEAHFLTDEGPRTLVAVQFDDDLHGTSVLPHDIEVSLRFPAELRSFAGKFLGSSEKERDATQAQENNGENVVDKLSKLFQVKDWRTNLLYPIFQTSGPREPLRNDGATPYYYSEGFLALQVVITYLLILGQLSITSLKTIPFNTLPIIQLQRFPHASWNEDPLLPALISFIGILIMLSFVYTCINTVKVITTEKEKQLKEAMKIMGLPNWLHWSAWFIKSLTFLTTSITCIVVLLTIRWYPGTSYSTFTYANPLILFLFLLFYICATITFCFSVSVFFSKANTAATVAGLLWFLSYAPYLFLQTQYDQLSLATKLVVCLGSNTAMAYGFQVFLMYEGANEGIQWHNIWEPNTVDDNLSLGLVMVMLAIDSLIYLCIALYVEAVFPGEYGTPQPWYFPFSFSYWCGSPKHVIISENFSDYYATRGDFFEKNTTNLKPGIQIKNLRKVFGKKVAVNNLTLDMYYDQITVLLGHNGAGKTSTMSMLTGIIPATNGTAFIHGFDIRTNMKDVRANLGLCPQHNILFDDLTVREHLYFFSKLKGLHKEQICEEINKYVHLLELETKIDKRSSTLSGGMKRKLCVAIALCGGSEIILLDEPTAGIDPSSRRVVWDLLQAEKRGRCLLLTTHYMDEADLLGDRIAIMANGSLKCYGSSFFLKKKYGAGYHLILDKLSNCEPDNVTKLLQKYIPDIQINGNVGSELTYLLKEDYVTRFEKMLEDLENNTQKLGIRSYGISLTTLEDVFIRVGADSASTNVTENKFKRRIDTSAQPTKSSSKNIVFLSGSELIRNQFLAMLMKRSLSIFRTWLLQIIQILLPVAFLIIAIIVGRNMNKNKMGNLPKLLLTLKKYENPVILVQDDLGNDFSKHYFEILRSQNVKNVSDINEAMLNLSGIIPSTVRDHYLAGASFQLKDKHISVLTAWFNNNPYHTPPLALGLILNTIYKTLLGKEYNILFSNYPLPFTTETKVEKLLKGNHLGFQMAFNIGFSMCFVSSFYILFYVKERVCKSKHLQFASGVKGYIFWTTSFLCDLITFVVTILFILLTLACFQEEGFGTGNELARMFLILFYFGFSMLPMMYFASYLFDIPSTGYTRMTLFSVFTGPTAFLAVQILSTPGLSLKDVADFLHWGFLLVPHYSLATGIRDTYITFVTEKTCTFFVNNCMERKTEWTEEDCWNLLCSGNYSQTLTRFCCAREHDYFSWESPGICRNVLFSLLMGIFLFFFLNLMEYKIFSKTIHLLRKRKMRTLQNIPDEDDDVLEEKVKIRNTPEWELLKNHSLVLKDLTKYYKHILAVNGLCLGIKQFECFGLLGLNGAGKTTTFKMITGDIKITYGNAWVHGFSVRTHIKNVQRLIGYCPQFDALLVDLTAKETLIIYALIRGIPSNECKYVSEKLAQDFDFYQHLNKQVKHMSGGNKRKLSTAISLIGDPAVICLDEPTAGMDPVTKRNLWNAICTVRDSGKCVLLTSHSMEECEALCTRLAIMVNGNFKCLGSVQHLKNKFAAGYSLTIKIKRKFKDEESRSVENFVSENFPTAIKQEKHQELVSYYIVDENVSWSKMFGILENAKNKLNIEDYSLGQATLEQIFLSLTKFQR